MNIQPYILSKICWFYNKGSVKFHALFLKKTKDKYFVRYIAKRERKLNGSSCFYSI